MMLNTPGKDPNNKVIYLDNAATTFPKPATVYEAADHFYREFGGNAGRGSNPLARVCSDLLDKTRHRLAEWLSAPLPEGIIFTSSATHALNLAILGHNFRAGDTIYVSPFEHNSVLRSVEHLRVAKGVDVKQIPFDRRAFSCDFDKLESAFRINSPAMVCITQASNVCGIMPPVIDIARLAKRINPKVVVVVDGAQTAGLYPLPLGDSFIDAFIFSGHKSLYGPYGIAGLVLASTWRPLPLLFGGTGTVSESVQMPEKLPSAYEAGSHNMWALAGLYAALEWLDETSREAVTTHALNLAQQLKNELGSYPGIDLYVPDRIDVGWCGILSFNVLNVTPQAIEVALGAKDIAVRAGLHCAPWAHNWLQTSKHGGTIRLSPGYLNRESDIFAFMNIIRSIL